MKAETLRGKFNFFRVSSARIQIPARVRPDLPAFSRSRASRVPVQITGLQQSKNVDRLLTSIAKSR